MVCDLPENLDSLTSFHISNVFHSVVHYHANENDDTIRDEFSM
jgi:hypothetical protein